MAVGERLIRFERVVVARPGTVPPREGGGQLLDQLRRDHLVSPLVHFSAPHPRGVLAVEHGFDGRGVPLRAALGVGTTSVVSSAAMLRSDAPPALAATMRATTSRGSAEGRPSRTP